MIAMGSTAFATPQPPGSRLAFVSALRLVAITPAVREVDS